MVKKNKNETKTVIPVVVEPEPLKPAVQKPLKVANPPPQISEAKKIWEEIKDEQLNMFALPNQTVEQYCKFFPIEPMRCFITINVSSVLTALEEALGKKFNFESTGKFIIITRR